MGEKVQVRGSKSTGLFQSANVIYHQNLVITGQRVFELFLKDQKVVWGVGEGVGVGNSKTTGFFPFTNVTYHQNLVTIGQRPFELLIKDLVFRGGRRSGGRGLKTNPTLPMY